MAGFEGPRYRATVFRFTASSRAIRRPDQPLRANALFASEVLTQRWFIRPHEPNNRARSAMNFFTSDSGWFATAIDWLVLTARWHLTTKQLSPATRCHAYTALGLSPVSRFSFKFTRRVHPAKCITKKPPLLGWFCKKAALFWGGSVAEVFRMNSKTSNPFGLN